MPKRATTRNNKFHDCSEGTLRKRLQFYGCQCSWCGNKRGRDFHHIQPEAAGGSAEWNNLIWVCETCHTLLDEFCSEHWSDPKQAERMKQIRSYSIDNNFQFCEGKINKKGSKEKWVFGNIFEMGKEGKMIDPPRTPDDIWSDLRETRKYMKIDRILCCDYLLKFSVHQDKPIMAFGYRDKRPIIIAAPSLETLLKAVKELGEEDKTLGKAAEKEADLASARQHKQLEDEFFHDVFRQT